MLNVKKKKNILYGILAILLKIWVVVVFCWPYQDQLVQTISKFNMPMLHTLPLEALADPYTAKPLSGHGRTYGPWLQLHFPGGPQLHQW